MADRAFKPTVRRIVVPRGGRIDSDKISQFVNQAAGDISGLGQFLTEMQSRVDQEATVKGAELKDMRQRFEQLSAEINAMRVRDAVANTALVYHITMYESAKHDFLPTSAFANRVLVNTQFGEATVPINGAEPRFFRESISSGAVVPIEDLSVTVTGTFDALDGQGVINHEQGGTVTLGEPLNAFNGNNNSRWIRRISFPLYSDVTEVMTELTVDVPTGSGGDSNSVYVMPVPAGEVDLLGVYTSPDLADSFILVDGFTNVEGASPTRWLFPVRPVMRVKVRLRQRNWTEEDGQKVFYVGAQEIGLQLLEFDKTYSSLNPLNLNHTVVLKQTAPDGYLFNALTSLITSPVYTLEDVGSRHIHVKVSTSSDGSTPIWDSDTDALPQATTTGFSTGTPVGTLYFMVTLNWVASSGGASSPFSVGTSPVFKGLSFEAKVEAE